MELLAVAIIFIALVFDYINGFHDAANSIATIIATKVLSPLRAVLWAAFFNFIAAFMFGTHVARTIGKGVIHPEAVDLYVILAALLGAIIWNMITWYFGLPTSSSHALIGGFIGAVLMKSQNIGVIILPGLYKILAFIVISPLIGMMLGYIIMTFLTTILYRVPPGKIDQYFRRLQLVSAASYSLGHGLNDAQKTMGIIWILLITAGWLSNDDILPMWVILSCHAAIALGTLSGGWRIVKTMGMKITKLKPISGFSAETAAGAAIIGVSCFGIPVSTTHTITGAIIGVGTTNRLSAVRWGIAGRIVWAWILTLPMSAVIAAAVYYGLTLITN